MKSGAQHQVVYDVKSGAKHQDKYSVKSGAQHQDKYYVKSGAKHQDKEVWCFAPGSAGGSHTLQQDLNLQAVKAAQAVAGALHWCAAPGGIKNINTNVIWW